MSFIRRGILDEYICAVCEVKDGSKDKGVPDPECISELGCRCTMVDEDEEHTMEDKTLIDVLYRYRVCKNCQLYRRRKNIVFGEGDEYAKIAVIGEGPGRDEDRIGLPFQGAAGRTLRNAILDTNIPMKMFFIANIVCCRPSSNRNPVLKEMMACWPRLVSQLYIVNPDVILCLGAVAANWIMFRREAGAPRSKKIGELVRKYGKKPLMKTLSHPFNNIERVFPVIPTYHPSYLNRTHSRRDKEMFKEQILYAAEIVKKRKQWQNK